MAPHHHTTHFQTRKLNCLSKRDKSSAGRIDPRAVDICDALNKREEYYTTSSCAGRCFLYCGDGIKSWHNNGSDTIIDCSGTTIDDGGLVNDAVATSMFDEMVATIPGGTTAKLGFFQRFRVNHDLIIEPARYFDLTTIIDGQDPTGGGDPIPSVGQFDHGNNAAFKNKLEQGSSNIPITPIWLRYEPFILHVMCRSLQASSALMALARPAFKNVGLTSWHSGSDDRDDDENDMISTESKNAQQKQQCKGGGPRYLVAIWGDEGLDMPLSLPTSVGSGLFYNPDDDGSVKNAEWLAGLVNERHVRNWKKIERFIESMRSLEEEVPVDANNHDRDGEEQWTYVDADVNTNDPFQSERTSSRLPRSYDVVGDVAILNCLPEGDEDEQRKVGDLIMSRNKAIKICVARTNPLSTSNRSPGVGLLQLAGPARNPIITSHCEYGVKCYVDLQHTFFSPRMALERLRLSQQVARGERVLVVFAGVGMEALQIVSRTEAREVLTIDKNVVAIECLRRAKQILHRNQTATCPGGGAAAATRLTIMEGDALEILPKLESESFDRIVAPRPKEGTLDGDIGSGDSGKEFLLAMLPLLKVKGECHWYDFAADHELPECRRTRDAVEAACLAVGLSIEVIHVAKVGSVARRQFRICLDFRITGKSNS